MIFKFGIVQEDNLTINSVVGTCDLLPRSSGIGPGLGTSQIKFFIIFQNNEYVISDRNRKLKLFQKDFFHKNVESTTGSGFNYSIQIVPPAK
jgi:hypothetical protein